MNKPPESSTAPASGFARKMLSLDVGPKISLSFWKLLGSAAIGVVVVGGLAWFVIGQLDAKRLPAVLPACTAIMVVQTVGLLALRPWKARFVGRWGMAWLAGRGFSLAALLVFGGLLYFPSRPDPLAYGLVAVGAYVVSLAAEVAAYTFEVKAKLRPEPPDPSGSPGSPESPAGA